MCPRCVRAATAAARRRGGAKWPHRVLSPDPNLESAQRLRPTTREAGCPRRPTAWAPPGVPLEPQRFTRRLSTPPCLTATAVRCALPPAPPFPVQGVRDMCCTIFDRAVSYFPCWSCAMYEYPPLPVWLRHVCMAPTASYAGQGAVCMAPTVSFDGDLIE